MRKVKRVLSAVLAAFRAYQVWQLARDHWDDLI